MSDKEFDRDQLPTPDENTLPDYDESDGFEMVVPEDMREPVTDDDAST